MRNLMYALFVIVSGMGMTRCSDLVHVDLDPEVDLNRYRSFKFVDGEDEAGPNPLYHSSLLENAIHAEIAMEMEKRGFDERTKHPELLVAYHTYTQRKQSAVNNYYPMMYGGWGWRYYPWGFYPYPYSYWGGYSSSYEYTEGTLIVDVINAANKQLIWRGSISDALTDPSNLHKRAGQAVRMIFKRFPVKERSVGKKVEKVNPKKVISRK